MPLRLGDIWRRYSAIGNWRFPGEPVFARSRAFELLARDLRRYVLEEVAGRSFLIAGHRGAGKTSTVAHAVRELRREIVTNSVDPVTIQTGRRGRLQRPMIVKLVGEAVLAPPPRQKEVGEAAAAASPDAAAGKPAADAASPGPAKDGEKDDRVGNALAHIAIGLYRALAAEVAEAFAVHALGGHPRERADRLELAAQLALELDGMPEPAALRGFWDRIGRLDRGVLWPPEADEALAQSAIRDQGLREVVAIATAAQAFQVCSGAVTYSVSREQSDRKESKSEAGSDWKELVNRLGALGAGALAGSVVGVDSGALPGVGIGLLVWLASGVTLKWTSTRERKSSRTLDYQFIQDRSIQTLDRDLPVVIERIRHAGLAPVFVIDELDKLEEKEPGELIRDIINRLKHLVADYGFFCFLANRDYFDLIERKVASAPYPTEHTYFSERVLVLSRAEDLFDYLIGLLDDLPADGPAALRGAVFALVVMFRSKLNFSDVARQVAILTGPNDELICADDELLAPGRYRLAATIQIAINRVLAREEVAERIQVDSAFAQLAIDALYYIPRKWESDADDCFDISAGALRDDLLKRMGADPTPAADPAMATDVPGPHEEWAISPPDLRELCKMVGELARYLDSFRALQDELRTAAQKAATPAEAARLTRLADIVIVEMDRLIEKRDEPGRYCFVLNELARTTTPQPPLPSPPPAVSPPITARSRRAAKPKAGNRPAGTPDKPTSPEGAISEASTAGAAAAAEESPAPAPAEPDPRLREPGELLRTIVRLLARFEVSVDDLVAAEVLPAIVSQSLLENSLGDIALATEHAPQPDAAERVINAYLAFVRALNDRGAEAAQALVLTARTKRDSGSPDPPPKILARLSRYFESSGPLAVPANLRDHSPWVGLAGNVKSIDEFLKEYAASLVLPPGVQELLPWRVEDMIDLKHWNQWRIEVERFVLGRWTAPAQVTYQHAVTAAGNRPPGKLFRLHLDRMDAVDWSRVALAGVPDPVIEAPLWPLFAGLAALGFDSGLMRQIQPKESIPPEDIEFINRLISLRGSAPKAILHVLPDQPRPRTMPISPAQPVLAVGASEFPSYVPALNWLAELDAFGGGTRELA